MKIIYFRHGHAAEADKYDDGRLLSEQGVQDAKNVRKLLGNPKFDLAIVSSMTRTRQTMRIVGDIDYEGDMRVVEDLFYAPTAEDAKLLDDAYQAIGNKSHLTYMDENDEVYFALNRHGNNAEGQILDLIIHHLGDVSKDDVTIGIAGHAVFGPAMMLALCNRYPVRDVSAIEETALQSGDAIILDTKAKTIEYLEYSE